MGTEVPGSFAVFTFRVGAAVTLHFEDMAIMGTYRLHAVCYRYISLSTASSVDNSMPFDVGDFEVQNQSQGGDISRTVYYRQYGGLWKN